jgi:hypothetical protein
MGFGYNVFKDDIDFSGCSNGYVGEGLRHG